MKEIIVLGGANGSGKSTLADLLVAQTGYLFLNADEIEKQLKQNNTGGNTHLQAGRLLFERLRAAQEAQVSFILESTLSGKTLLPLLRDLIADGYRLRLVYIFLENPALCIARIRNRVQKGGHHVADEDVRRRYYRSLHNFWQSYRVLADEWNIYLNTGNFPDTIAFGRYENITILDENHFKIFQNLLNNA